MNLTIKAEKRESGGKNFARRIRREGNVPAILYGPGTENVPLVFNKKDIFDILKSETGENTIFQVLYDKDKPDVMIKDYQQDVTTDEILHVDLIHISMDKEVRVTVPIILTGDAVGVKTEGGFVEFVTREVEVECLPNDIPENILVDISELHLNQSIKIEELASIEGVKVMSDPNYVIVAVEAPAAEEVVEAVEEEEEIMAEGEQPEVIKKEKDEEEGKAEAAKE
ncbi:MAG: 50S ribosomal protein L25 [Candidatus Aminicenantaceae bacterium]